MNGLLTPHPRQEVLGCCRKVPAVSLSWRPASSGRLAPRAPGRSACSCARPVGRSIGGSSFVGRLHARCRRAASPYRMRGRTGGCAQGRLGPRRSFPGSVARPSGGPSVAIKSSGPTPDEDGAGPTQTTSAMVQARYASPHPSRPRSIRGSKMSLVNLRQLFGRRVRAAMPIQLRFGIKRADEVRPIAGPEPAQGGPMGRADRNHTTPAAACRGSSVGLKVSLIKPKRQYACGASNQAAQRRMG
jgi:hypothetical protein